MGEKKRIKGTASVTVEVPFEIEIDLEDFYDWAEGDELTSDHAREYLESDRDYPANLNIPKLPVSYPVQDVEIYRVHV